MTALTADFLGKYDLRDVPWGGAGMGEIVNRRTYSRRKDDGAMENWHETNLRAIKGTVSQLDAGLTDNEQQALFHYTHFLMGSFSGRALWQLGTQNVERFGASSLCNCYYLGIDRIEDLETLMSYLMLGGGVGYSVERARVHDLPPVRRDVTVSHLGRNDADFIVADSREGWIRLLHAVLKSFLYTGKSFTYSTILIRAQGTRLENFGGTASGPDALILGMQDIVKVFQARAGKKLRSIDVLDICNIIGRLVLAGSSRRSSQIALGDPDDFLFLRAKNWGTGKIPPWRSQSNNTIVADDVDEIVDEVWKGYDGSGEPYGFFNRRLARETGRLGEQVDDGSVAGMNPCLTGDTLIMTAGGPKRIDSITQPCWAVVDGQAHSATASWASGVRPVFRLVTKEGYELRLTGDHKVLRADGVMVRANDLIVGDSITINDHRDAPDWGGRGTEDEGYLVGMFKGDGTIGKSPGGGYAEGAVAIAKVWTKDRGSETMVGRSSLASGTCGRMRSDFAGWRDSVGFKLLTLNKPMLTSYGVMASGKPLTQTVETTSAAFHRGFLQAFFDTDGHVEGWQDDCRNGGSVRLSQSNRDELLVVQRMLLRFGIQSTVYPARDAGARLLPDGRGGSAWYHTKSQWRLVISSESVRTFAARIGFVHSGKANRLSALIARKSCYRQRFVATVSEFIPDGEETVFDLSVADVHAMDANGIVVSNCGEITLANGESCNLGTLFLPNIPSLPELVSLATCLYKVCKAVTTLDYTDPRSTAIVHQNRRIGLSVAGYLQATDEQRLWLPKVYKELRWVDKEWSKKRGLPESVKLTTVQPGGTLPLLPGVTSGTSPAYDRFIIRRVRMASYDPLVDHCRRKGYNVVTEVGIDGRENHDLAVVEFPVETPRNTPLAKDLTALEQLQWVRHAQTNWSDNAVSCTIYYRKDELPGIKAYLREHYNDSIKSVSFLLHSEHGFNLPPLEGISEAEFRRRKSRVKDDVVLDQDLSGDLLDIECESGACPVR